jgi:hypothetical protein
LVLTDIKVVDLSRCPLIGFHPEVQVFLQYNSVGSG